MTALAAYFDDSKNQDDGIVVVAGYLGPITTWDEGFTPAWWRALDSMPRKVPEFKASDCRHGVKSFGGWTKPERDELTAKVVSVITDSAFPGIIGIGGAALVGPTEGDPQREKVKTLAHLVCLIVLIGEVLALCERSSDDVHFIFDNQPGLESTISELFKQLPRSLPDPLRTRLHPPQFGNSRDLAPLQAADLLAHETYKEMKNRQERPPRETSVALSRLLNERPHIAYYFDTGRVHEMLRHAESGTAPVAQGGRVPPAMYDSLATEQVKLALQELSGVTEPRRAPSWLDPFLNTNPVRLAQRGLRVIEAVGDIQTIAISLNESGTLTVQLTRNVLDAVREVMTIGRRLPDELFTAAPNDATVRSVLAEFGSALAALLVQLPPEVIATAGESVLVVQMEGAALLGRANMRDVTMPPGLAW